MTNSYRFIGCESEFEEASIVIFGAPFDSTTSYRPGARFGPSAIRNESYGIETYSPYQDMDLTDIPVHDAGDLELPFGNIKKTLDEIQLFTYRVISSGKIPVLIGGEHLVSLGAIRAAFIRNPEMNIIHFDAHADLRDSYLEEKYSHATVMRRAWNMLGDGRIYQFGIRSGEIEEFKWADGHVKMNKFDMSGLDKVINELKGKPIYFSLDLDVLDPSVFPGTGTPEAGGISFMELLSACIKLSELNVIAMDINELSPPYDPSGISTMCACKILRELLIAIGKQ